MMWEMRLHGRVGWEECEGEWLWYEANRMKQEGDFNGRIEMSDLWFLEEDERGRVIVTTDEERVQWGAVYEGADNSTSIQICTHWWEIAYFIIPPDLLVSFC